MCHAPALSQSQKNPNLRSVRGECVFADGKHFGLHPVQYATIVAAILTPAWLPRHGWLDLDACAAGGPTVAVGDRTTVSAESRQSVIAAALSMPIATASAVSRIPLAM